jgi:DNA-binding LacI/PurR family transcriptional regulator
MLDVPLTSVKQNIPAISSNISMLLDKLLAGDLEINNIVLPTIITERNSVKEIV